MKLITVRHGETIENVKHVCQEITGGHLSKKGIDQAKKLALRFKDTKIDAIYCSDAKRTMDTAKEILKYHPKLKLNLDKRLREQELGKQQGLPFPKNWDWDNLPKDCETGEKMCIKVKNFLDEIYNKHKNQTVLIVCHDGTKRSFILLFQNKPVSEFAHLQGIKNTCVSEFEIEKNGNYKTHVLNCIKHLK